MALEVALKLTYDVELNAFVKCASRSVIAHYIERHRLLESAKHKADKFCSDTLATEGWM